MDQPKTNVSPNKITEMSIHNLENKTTLDFIKEQNKTLISTINEQNAKLENIKKVAQRFQTMEQQIGQILTIIQHNEVLIITDTLTF